MKVRSTIATTGLVMVVLALVVWAASVVVPIVYAGPPEKTREAKIVSLYLDGRLVTGRVISEEKDKITLEVLKQEISSWEELKNPEFGAVLAARIRGLEEKIDRANRDLNSKLDKLMHDVRLNQSLIRRQ